MHNFPSCHTTTTEIKIKRNERKGVCRGFVEKFNDNSLNCYLLLKLIVNAKAVG